MKEHIIVFSRDVKLAGDINFQEAIFPMTGFNILMAGLIKDKNRNTDDVDRDRYVANIQV